MHCVFIKGDKYSLRVMKGNEFVIMDGRLETRKGSKGVTFPYGKKLKGSCGESCSLRQVDCGMLVLHSI